MRNPDCELYDMMMMTLNLLYVTHRRRHALRPKLESAIGEDDKILNEGKIHTILYTSCISSAYHHHIQNYWPGVVSGFAKILHKTLADSTTSIYGE